VFDKLKKKFKEFRLRDLFRRKAQPPVPKEIVENKAVQKAVFKHVGRRGRRRLRNVFLASAALSTVLQFTPDLVSTKYDDYMAQKGYPADLSQHFHTGEIRVYDRVNPLYPFHLAGREVQMIWHEGMKENRANAIGLAIATPFVYTAGLFGGFLHMLPGNPLDAYSMANNDNHAQRVNFIRPPGEFSAARFFEHFSGIDSEGFSFKNDPAQLKRVLFEFVMLHEARHGDQQKLASATANESDADLYAFRVLEARGTNPALLEEAATLIMHARTINSVIGGDISHASSFALLRGSERLFDAHQDAAVMERLHNVLDEADAFNDKAFPPGMKSGNRYVYLALALHNRGILDEDPDMKLAAAAFVTASAYFDNVSGGKIIDRRFNTQKLDFSYLTNEYRPVPDKLNVKKAPRPNS
jgi:hypothetical protein